MRKKQEKFIVANYTPQGYPKLHAKVGDEGLSIIQEHDNTSAKIVSKLNHKVAYVGYSESRSSLPETIASFVRCKDGKVFYVVNRELQK